MSETVDTGFEDVIAGERWEEPAPAVTVHPYPGDGKHTCVGAGERCDICFGPLVTATVIPEPEPPAPSPLPSTGLTAAGVQAAKALVALPSLDAPSLAKLAREMAMDIKERHVVLKDYGLNDTQYEFLEANNEFYRAALQAACTEWHAPLSTSERIKVEAAAILEDALPGLGARMQNKAEGLPGVIEAAKLFAKVAGVGERDAAGAAPGERFTINIDLGGDQKIVVASTPAPQASAGAAGRSTIFDDPPVQGATRALPAD